MTDPGWMAALAVRVVRNAAGSLLPARADIQAGDGVELTDLGSKTIISRNWAKAGEHEPVVAVAHANIASLAAAAVADDFDDITVAETNRVLLPFQTTQAENGIYVVGSVAAGNAALTRAADFDAAAEMIAGASFYVQQGTLWGKRTFRFQTTGAIVVDTTALAFRDTLGQRYAGTFESSDATANQVALTIATVAGLNNWAVRIFGEDGAGNQAEWETNRHYKNVSGTVTLLSSSDVTPYAQMDGTWGTPNLNISNPNVQARITGKVGTDITWVVRVFEVEDH